MAVVPVMKRKSFKELGTPTVQAAELADTIKELTPDELLERAEAKRAALEEAGDIDRVADQNPEHPPQHHVLVGKWLEICWRYWRPPTAAEKAKGDKRKKIATKIWCACEVMQIANGTSTTVNPDNAKCRQLADAGAVRVRWPADPVRKEKESFSWHILQDELWNPTYKDVHLAWRYTGETLAKLTAAERASGKRQKR